ncbi:NAD(P)/FAD-dependent oxidoreductase [Roseibium salinum]|uniref:NAD(P)/FAD-dependent oxidoreductase n=1 Tax=Roseibium salinum TaxID=1604349 RepID=UPI0035EAE0BB
MTHDVIIVGAGPAGSTAAIELARQGRSVALVEKDEFPRRKVCGEYMSATNIPVLQRLGVAEAWRDRAGPEIRKVALFAGQRIVSAPMPGRDGFGRALGRDVHDTLLRDAAGREGVELYQPCRAVALCRVRGRHELTIDTGSGGSMTLSAPVVIAAHGSWERNTLPTGLQKGSGTNGLLGFKAHFRGASLARDTMPLLAFPGGYGGIVWADAGRLSLSCCIRSEALAALRQRRNGNAAEVIHAHLLATCRGVREALAGAILSDKWLSTGTIRPAVRARYAEDIFRAGNLAGEAHPVIAEGISMAIQSASLLAQVLDDVDITDPAALAAAGQRYSAAWSRHFKARLRMSQTVAWMASRPEAFGFVAATIEAVPKLLTFGAGLSGKAQVFSPGK